MVLKFIKRAWRFFTRMDISAILILTVLLIAAIGSLFPQRSFGLETDPERLALWENGVRGQYGALTAFLTTIGIFHAFRSPLFLLSLTLLAIATLLCTLDRWRTVWRRVFQSRIRCSESTLLHSPHTACLTVPEGIDLRDILQENLEHRGFHVRSENVDSTIYMRGDRNRLSPLGTLLSHLGVVLLLLGTLLSTNLGWREELSIDPGQSVSIQHSQGMTISNQGFTIERYPDGSAAGYQAEIILRQEGQEVTQGYVRLNEPLIHSGISIYLQGFTGIAGNFSLMLLVAHEPGYGLVITAGFFLLIGMAVSFNFPRCCIYARVQHEGTVHIAGQAERRAHDFGLEFAELIKLLNREIDKT
jgi:cytochrome c biogenesis protein